MRRDYCFWFKHNVLRDYYNRHLSGMTIDMIVANHSISRSTLYRWVHQYPSLDAFKSCPKKPFTKRSKYHSKVVPLIKDYIVNYAVTTDYFNSKVLHKQILDVFNISINRRYIYHILAEKGVTYKKCQKFCYDVTSITTQNQITDLQKEILSVNKKFISVDETAAFLFQKPNYRWQYKGKRAQIKVSKQRKKYSVLKAISEDKIIACWVSDGAITGPVYEKFITEEVIPKSGGAAILMDNAVIHKTKKFTEKMKKLQQKIIYNVPYMPKFNPIEYLFNPFKNGLRSKEVNNKEDLIKCIREFMEETTDKKLKGYYEKASKELFSYNFEQPK